MHLPDAEKEKYLTEVRNYWEKVHSAYLEHVGTTFQAGRIKPGSQSQDARASNQYLAARAGILPGMRVLDAGCGVCGPAVDIASSIAGVSIAAITLSRAQARTAKELVGCTGILSPIHVYVADYHELPFKNAIFDLVFFFESSGYCYDSSKLYLEIQRVLRAGGILYIKDVFKVERQLSGKEEGELIEFDKTFATKTASMSETVNAISTAGLQILERRDLTEAVSTEHIREALFTLKDGTLCPTRFGELHIIAHRRLPVLFGEIRAIKPD